MRGRPTAQGDIEDALFAENERLERLTNGGFDLDGDEVVGYDELCSVAAEAEATWKIEFAKGMIAQAGRMTGGRPEAKHTQEARVYATKADMYRQYKMAAAMRDARKEALATVRARIDTLRTMAANVRGQT